MISSTEENEGDEAFVPVIAIRPSPTHGTLGMLQLMVGTGGYPFATCTSSTVYSAGHRVTEYMRVQLWKNIKLCLSSALVQKPVGVYACNEEGCLPLGLHGKSSNPALLSLHSLFEALLLLPSACSLLCHHYPTPAAGTAAATVLRCKGGD